MKASRVTGSAHRRRIEALVAALAAVLLALFLTPQQAEARKHTAAEFHTVQSGDTWRSIAAFYGTPVETIWEANGVTNPSLLAAGQRLFIPSPGPSAHSGILLFEINSATPITASAVKSGNGLSGVLWLNGYDSPAQAYGQQLYVPDRQSSIGVSVAENTPLPATTAPSETAIPTEAPTDVPAPTPGPTPTATPGPEGELNAQLMGIQGHFLIDDATRKRMLDLVAYDLGFGWIKQQVEWSQFEYAPGQYSQDMLNALDAFMQNCTARQLHVLLGIATPPDWALRPADQGGVDQNAFNDFVKFITLRYKYQIGAIEIWNEPNLGREWGGSQVVSAPQYVNLLAGAYQTIKTVYPEGHVVVVSAGLAPTGVNDGVTAIDDRAYFTQMYQAGVQNYADAIGIHPYGWGNPPDSRCCEPAQYVLSHYDHPSFYFLNTVEDYHAIMQQFGDTTHKLWATEFGWGTVDGIGRPIPPDAPYFAYVTSDQQGTYIVRAYQMAQSWDYMGPMFLWNLNIAIFPGSDDNQSGYSIITHDEVKRPAYIKLSEAAKYASPGK